MKVVIDIPDRVFEKLQNGEIQFGGITSRSIFWAFKDGTPLPKGHGDLIDRSKLKIVNLGIGDYDVWGVEDYVIADALPVIPADKTVEDTSITKDCITCKHYAPDDYDISDRCCECLEDNVKDKIIRNDKSLWKYPKWEAKENKV